MNILSSTEFSIGSYVRHWPGDPGDFLRLGYLIWKAWLAGGGRVIRTLYRAVV